MPLHPFDGRLPADIFLPLIERLLNRTAAYNAEHVFDEMTDEQLAELADRLSRGAGVPEFTAENWQYFAWPTVLSELRRRFEVRQLEDDAAE